MKKIIALTVAAGLSACVLPFAACQKKSDKISSYSISATYDGANMLNCQTEFTFYNDTENEIDELKFNLWGNAYREDATYKPVSEASASEAYYAGASYGDMSVENVDGCQSWGVCGDDENILSVKLSSPVYPEEKTSVTITSVLNLAKVNHRTGITANTVNLGNFYPVLCAYNDGGFVEYPYISCGDPFVSACADYEVSLTCPTALTAAASGKLISESVAGANKTCNYELKCARDFAFILSEKFEKISKSCNGTEISYYYYEDSQPQAALSAASESFEYFSSTFGAYPYPTLSVVQTGFCTGGMEYPGLTMISDKLDETTDIYTIVHENAHQWWYATVGSDQINCSWQDEGLAEYSTLMFFEKNPGYGITRTGMLGSATKSYRAFYSVYNQLFGGADTTMNRPLDKFISDYEYANVAYNKGLLMFEAVRAAMGDEKFKDSLKEYFNDNKFKIATAESLIAPFAKRADVEGVFASFLEGKVII